MPGFVIVPNIPTVEEFAQGGTLVSSNIAETEHPAWSAATNYSVGTRVIYVHAIYQRLVAGTTATAPSADTVNWAYVRPTNRYAAFDTSSSTATTSSSTISIVLQPGRAVDAVAVLGVTGTSVRIRISDPSMGITYDQTRTLDATNSAPTWYSYFFDVRTKFTQFIARPKPYSTTAQVMIDITPKAGVASVSTILTGIAREYGAGTSYGARLGITDYSVKQTNTFGDTVLVQRAFSKRGEFQVQVPNTQTDSLFALLSSLRATPALFIAADTYESASIYGYLKDWGVTLSFPTVNYVDLQIEGLA